MYPEAWPLAIDEEQVRQAAAHTTCYSTRGCLFAFVCV